MTEKGNGGQQPTRKPPTNKGGWVANCYLKLGGQTLKPGEALPKTTTESVLQEEAKLGTIERLGRNPKEQPDADSND